MTHYPGIQGYQAKIYIPVSAADTELKIVGKVTVPRKFGEAESTSREDAGTRTWIPGLLEYGIQFFMQKRKGHPAYNVMRDAFLARTTLVFKVTDGPILTVGTDIITFSGAIFDMTNEEELEGVLGHNVVVKPTWAETPAAQTTVAS